MNNSEELNPGDKVICIDDRPHGTDGFWVGAQRLVLDQVYLIEKENAVQEVCLVDVPWSWKKSRFVRHP